MRLPRMEAFLIFLTTVMMVSLMMAADPFPACYAAYVPDEPYAVATVFADPAARQHHDDGDVCLSCRKRKHISESETRFRNAMEYSAIGMALVGTEGQWLQSNKALCQFLGYSQEELRGLTFQQLTWPEISIKISNRLKS